MTNAMTLDDIIDNALAAGARAEAESKARIGDVAHYLERARFVDWPDALGTYPEIVVAWITAR